MTENIISWELLTSDEFDNWYSIQPKALRVKILTKLELLSCRGPSLGRPNVDSVYCSIHSNMKELRISHKSDSIRIFFVFDPKRNVYVCFGGVKGDKKFYSLMIKKSDSIYSDYLQQFN